MGFREGEGLGKFGQGRKEIVEASTQRGRRGLGLTLQGFQGELNVDWRDEPEVFWLYFFINENYFLLYTSWWPIDMICCFLLTLFSPFLCFFFCLSIQPSAIEKVDWFPECTTENPDSDELRDWMVLGRVNTDTSDTHLFIDKSYTIFSKEYSWAS